MAIRTKEALKRLHLPEMAYDEMEKILSETYDDGGLGMIRAIIKTQEAKPMNLDDLVAHIKQAHNALMSIRGMSREETERFKKGLGK